MNLQRSSACSQGTIKTVNNMSLQIQLKPFVAEDGQKYKVIELTDIALHTAPKRPTPSHGKKIAKSFDRMEPGRIYSPIGENAIAPDGSFNLEAIKFDPEFLRMVQEAEAEGYKVLLGLPKGGMPVVPGADTVEFMKSKNGKRVLRGLAKEKDKS